MPGQSGLTLFHEMYVSALGWIFFRSHPASRARVARRHSEFTNARGGMCASFTIFDKASCDKRTPQHGTKPPSGSGLAESRSLNQIQSGFLSRVNGRAPAADSSQTSL